MTDTAAIHYRRLSCSPCFERTCPLKPPAEAMARLVAFNLRYTARHANPAALKDALADGIRSFETQARQRSLPNEQIVAGP